MTELRGWPDHQSRIKWESARIRWCRAGPSAYEALQMAADLCENVAIRLSEIKRHVSD